MPQAEQNGVRAPGLMPVGFVGHGSPLRVLDREGAPAAWRAWGQALPRPRAILMVSAHWQQRPPSIGATHTLPLVYDFYGFPDELYAVQYPAPGAPELAGRALGLLEAAGLRPTSTPQRWLDHGAWAPLVHMFPAADVPVLQVSLGQGQPLQQHLALGQALAPLRAEGVLILGSGNVVHNLRQVRFASVLGAVDGWAQEFDQWVAEALDRFDLDTLVNYADRAPGARLAVPTDEHYTPLLVAAAAADSGRAMPTVSYPHVGFEHGSLSMRSVQFA